MSLIINPSIATRIRRMKDRVRWQHPYIQQRQIDQTRLALADPLAEDPNAEFSFLVIGDTGWGPREGHHPQREIAKHLLKHVDDNRFLLHTGDVVYLVGSRDQYSPNFIEPYQEFIVGGHHPSQVRLDEMTFNFPFLPVLGNHDYYDVPGWTRILLQFGRPLLDLFDSGFENNIGREGSCQGDVYAHAFMDYLQHVDLQALARYLDDHYTVATDTGSCLHYEPGQHTRLPNRYYRFRYAGIDFFALDSNTLNHPDETDPDQLEWLTEGLRASWSNPAVRGRILFCHHPPYVTETTKWDLEETLILRWRLRQVLDQVAETVECWEHPLVDLVLSGHAHCLEHIQSSNTGHADSYLNWVVCGGSGCSVRRQRWGTSELMEPFVDDDNEDWLRPVGSSKLYVGLTGHGFEERHPYTFLKIDVLPGTPLRLRLWPYVSEWYQENWYSYGLVPIDIFQAEPVGSGH